MPSDLSLEKSIASFNITSFSPGTGVIVDGLSLISSIINDSKILGNIHFNKNMIESHGSIVCVDDPHEKLMKKNSDKQIIISTQDILKHRFQNIPIGYQEDKRLSLSL